MFIQVSYVFNSVLLYFVLQLWSNPKLEIGEILHDIFVLDYLSLLLTNHYQSKLYQTVNKSLKGKNEPGLLRYTLHEKSRGGKLVSKMEICVKEEWRGGPTQTNCWTRLSELRDLQQDRESCRPGWMRENERKRAAMWSSGIYDYTVETHVCHDETVVYACTWVWTNSMFPYIKVCVNVCVGRGLRWWRGIFLGLSSALATIRLQRFLQEHATSAYGRL